MDPSIQHALEHDHLIDITTTGRISGRPHRIEIAFHYLDGDVYISGMPGKRDWYANAIQNPRFVLHLKQSTHADLPSTAIPITDEVKRREVLARIVERWDRVHELDAFVADSPLIEVRFNDPA
jgi:hypothetical protein